jgi:hypothetical protein
MLNNWTPTEGEESSYINLMPNTMRRAVQFYTLGEVKFSHEFIR